MRNWKKGLSNSNFVGSPTNSNYYQGTITTSGLTGVPGYEGYTTFTIPSPSDLVDECLKSVTEGLWSVFTPITASDILVKSAYPKMNMFMRKLQKPGETPKEASAHELVIDVAIPYVTEELLEIEANDETNGIVITAKNVQESEDVTYLMRDIPRGAIRQEIHFPKEHYSVKNVKADLRNGVLRLTLTRNTPVEPKPTTRKVKLG